MYGDTEILLDFVSSSSSGQNTIERIQVTTKTAYKASETIEETDVAPREDMTKRTRKEPHRTAKRVF